MTERDLADKLAEALAACSHPVWACGKSAGFGSDKLRAQAWDAYEGLHAALRLYHATRPDGYLTNSCPADPSKPVKTGQS